jgi:serine/threonine protein kinase
MIGTTFANRYEIIDRLGEGANDVWKAHDTHQDQLVALKTFRPGASTIHVYGEATILTALEGEHVLRVYNADTYDDIPYIAARIAAMGSAEGFREANPLGLPADTVVSWIRQALVGLGACHDRRLLHRDIKPDNIFLETPEFALLGDFGLSYQLDPDATAPADGSPFTIAPEMWSTDRGTIASDIYSMGETAYRLITGQWPFDLPSRDELPRQVPTGRYERLRERAPHISRRLADRIEKVMALRPADRYSTWRQMHADLGRAGVVGHVWRRRTPHSGHDRCWVQVRSLRGALHEVCVIATGANHSDVEVRHATGAGHRVRRLCKSGVDTRRLAAALRDVFDHI